MEKSFEKRILEMAGVRSDELPKQLIEGYKERYFNDTEQETVILVESRGVAITAYNGLISDIVNYLNETIHIGGTTQFVKKPYLDANGEKVLLPVSFYTIQIPNSIMYKWGLDGLDIVLNIFNYPTYEGYSFYDNDKDINGKEFTNQNINKEQIIIGGRAFDGNVDLDSFKMELIHEFNHFKAAEGQKKKGIKPFRVDNRLIRLKDNPAIDRITYGITTILYRLWNRDEMVAGATSVYSYIRENNLNRANFAMDVLETKAYDEYVNFSKSIGDIYTQAKPIHIELIKKLLKVKGNTDEQVLEWFCNASKELNKEYFQLMGRAASQAYDENEMKNKTI